MRMFGGRGGTESAEDFSDANKAALGGSNVLRAARCSRRRRSRLLRVILEGERVSFSRLRTSEPPRGQLDDLRRRRVDAGGAKRAQIRNRTDHLAVPIEERRVDREPHEERVDRGAGLDGETIAFAELSATEQAAHPLP